MTLDALIALLPLIAVSAASILVMLVVPLQRDALLPHVLTVTGLIAAALTVPLALQLAPVAVTGLLLVDRYALFFMGLILAAALAVTLLVRPYLRQERRQEIYVLLLTSTLGGLLLVSSSHLAMFFLGLEILSVSLFPMIAYRSANPLSLEAGIKYLMLSGMSSALLLFGMALIYCQLGVLSFEGLGATGGTLSADPIVVAGTLLIIAGLGFKLSLVPFHLWTPDVYQGAPAPVTAFVATVSKGALFALLLRFWIATGAYRSEAFLDILGLIAVVSVLAGNLLALLQNNLKRMLAYSSIAHMGYLLVAFVAGSVLKSPLLAESVGFYLLAYVITSLIAFGVIASLSSDERECEELGDYQGLAWREPWLAGMLILSLLSLAGIPLTIGFIGKFYVFAAGVDAGLWGLVWAVVIGSGIGIYYYLRVVLTLFKVSDTEWRLAPGGGGQGLARIALASLTALLLYIGILPEPAMNILLAVIKSLV